MSATFSVPMIGLTTGPRPVRPALRVVPAPSAIPLPGEFLRRVIAQREAEQEASAAKLDLSLPPMRKRKTDKLNFEALKAETPKGCCIGCDLPLPPRKFMLCGHPDCLQVYRDVWYGDRNAALRSKR